MVDFAEVNYLAVLIATIVTMVLGFLWYSPVLFGNAWMKQVGLKKEDVSGGHAGTYALTAFTAIIGAFLLALVLTITGEDPTVSAGLTVGLIVGLMVSAKIGMNYLFEGRSLLLFLITAGYHLVTFVLTGLIIGLI
ncbi:DUF1761 domain-containing protein [Paenibacillus montanisoli]|uniref:DUF1761 domain-containing protein n=1 Tax=Paenibacillus montanisoli TaxID=2081970 RepID=A0A328TVN7_9BACL|nr:DUF1761 domain-containing protein [Paenibacillus montanisoli]RAP73702.1 DUF1761 domain-containing protein [Paenibacillus montanisoli]